MRSLSYSEADVFLVSYKISDPNTLYNVKHKWIPEIRRHRNDVPVILCGCQSDLRHDPEVVAGLGKRGRTPVTSEQALAICCDVGAANYVETSAVTSEVIEAFEVAAVASASLRYKTTSSHGSSNANRFNTSSSKNSRLNVSFESAELSHGQIAQPQRLVTSPVDDVFPTSPVQRRSVVSQSFSGLRPVNLVTSPTASTGSSQAQIRANGLSRRTSFRSPTFSSGSNISGSKAVATPKSPLSDDSEDLKVKAKAYESLKSHGSTGSTGSKTSSTGSSSVMLEMEENVPNTEDPELLNHLNFVSPKVGVYRPVNLPSGGKLKDKDKCVLM